jgi:hypothetical protein
LKNRHASADRVAIASNTLQLELQKRRDPPEMRELGGLVPGYVFVRWDVPGRSIRMESVFQESEARTGVVADPCVKIAVPVPIGNRDGAAIIWEVEPGKQGHIGETGVSEIEEAAIAFMTAERHPFSDHFIQPPLVAHEGAIA